MCIRDSISTTTTTITAAAATAPASDYTMRVFRTEALIFLLSCNDLIVYINIYLYLAYIYMLLSVHNTRRIEVCHSFFVGSVSSATFYMAI